MDCSKKPKRCLQGSFVIVEGNPPRRAWRALMTPQVAFGNDERDAQLLRNF
jgi:hypothetical protein